MIMDNQQTFAKKNATMTPTAKPITKSILMEYGAKNQVVVINQLLILSFLVKELISMLRNKVRPQKMAN